MVRISRLARSASIFPSLLRNCRWHFKHSRTHILDWERLRQMQGDLRKPVAERSFQFIFLLVFVMAPKSTATSYCEQRATAVEGKALDEAQYFIDAKQAGEYGRFTETLVHHLEAHGVMAKHEAHGNMHRLLDIVLHEMRTEPAASTASEARGGPNTIYKIQEKGMAMVCPAQ